MNLDLLVSIIVPIYNSEKYLVKCISSILSQTYKNVEVILIDDGSTDNSSDICKEFMEQDKRIRYIYKTNEGVSSARNTALELVTGDFIAFVDSDDYLEDSYVISMLQNLMIENVDLSICGYMREKVDGTVTEYTKGKKRILHTKEAMELLFRTNEYQGFLWNKLFKTTLIKKNMINFNPEITIWEDMLFVSQYILYCQLVYYNPVPLYHYVINPNSVISNRTKKFNYKNLSELKASELMMTYLQDDYVEAYKKLKSRFALSNVGLFMQIITTQHKDRNLEILLKRNIRKNFFVLLNSNKTVGGENIYKISAILIALNPILLRVLINFKRLIIK